MFYFKGTENKIDIEVKILLSLWAIFFQDKIGPTSEIKTVLIDNLFWFLRSYKTL